MKLASVPLTVVLAAPLAAQTVENWSADLDRMVREVRYRHPNPEHFGPTWEEFIGGAKALKARLADLEDWHIPWELSRLVATLADGHTWVDPFSLDSMGGRTPLHFAFYDDGLYVIGYREERQLASSPELLGAKVVRIDGHEPFRLLQRARELRLTSADNEMSLRWWTAHHLTMPTAVALLGAPEGSAGRPERITYELESPRGEPFELVLEVGKESTGPATLLGRTDGSVWSPEHESDVYYIDVMPEEGVLYWRWNGFREQPDVPWEPFCADAFATFEREALERIVLDLRGNGGGDPDYGIPVLRGIVRHLPLEEPNALVVLIGPGTDSAGVSFCVELERLANPTFVGMPTFLRPNGHADAFDLKLPRTGLGLHVSTTYWRAGHPHDRRPWVAPHVAVPVRFDDVRAKRDPALELALAGVERPRRARFRPTVGRGTAVQDLNRELEAWRAAPERRWVDVELDINALGYELMGNGRLRDAREIFELNCRLHPYSANVHDSYGEALLKAGDRPGALRAYRESVRRDHSNIAAIQTILRLEDE